MSCPTCDHTLARICVHEDMDIVSCDRCGTLVIRILSRPENPGINPRVYVPKLVGRCRFLEETVATDPQYGDVYAGKLIQALMRQTGVTEAIHKTEDRP